MLKVSAVPAFKDNYVWLIHDRTHAAVVDPGDAAPVIAALEEHRLTLLAILLTHHHADHVGGVSPLLKHFNVPVFGPGQEGIREITHPVTEGMNISIPELNVQMAVLDVPGHTRGHVAYVEPTHSWLFCGDTLFAGGCGRLNEGTPEQLEQSLTKLAALPDTTQVYCAHEYTLANLRFALEVEPGNSALLSRLQTEQSKRNLGLPTLPSNIGLEKATNPFLRYRERTITKRVISEQKLATREPIAIFAALRQWKDTYR